MAAPSKKSHKRNSKDGGPKFNKSFKTAFKPSKERNKAVQSKAMALQLEDDVPDFPGGGVSSFGKREREEIHAEFGAKANKWKKNKRIKMQRKTAAQGDDLGSLFGNGITGKLPRFANKITLKNISPGMKLWGVVAEMNENEECKVLAQAESRSSIRPLKVILDDIEHSDVHIVASQNQGLSDTVDTVDGKEKRQAKEEREQEIGAAEERLLEKNIPTTADDYEKLVRSSPNSSLVWMKYMAFVLSLADVEKARSIAERALRTINVREENEKLNIWVAYFNLENEYGNPPEEAVMKVFHRALQCCDPKKIHLALLGMYERTGQDKFVDELLDKMIKKFKHSCKVWLRRVQSLLTQQQDRETRLGDVDVIRALFERAISLGLPPKKMKFLFKKYLEYEKSNGDEKRVEYVKQKAMDYAQSTLT
ncbi:hypothetical protein HS088_TW03G00973 [Tripterygium wilfordii]|uniref:Pre-mRNA-splicing factor Syf1-like N-terminal HAT-repeats domain-containing protein n=1 Tax=Tripterygium wilfordii TaxID=458696 RepID=A0A7J7DWU2_TRIWF|nr:hypothetical protein HS088_TW03G00973 [Tripterygium wilfordii]